MKVATEGTKLVFTFDGEAAYSFDTAAATQHHTRAMMHGFEQKLRDNAAIARKQKDGTVITVTEAMRRAAVAELGDHLLASSEWNMRGTGVVKENLAIRKLADRLGVTYAEAESALANDTLDELMGK